MKRAPKKWIDYTGWTVEQHKAYLRTEEAYLTYYKQFNPDSVEDFIRGYASSKHTMLGSEEHYRYMFDKPKTRFMDLADRYINHILQKKLFNLQCQWRACLVELPLVDFRGDFDYWESNIRSCPFLPLITQEDIDLCIRFLHERYDDSHNNYIETVWQDYEGFKNQIFFDDQEEEDERNVKLPYRGSCIALPELYDFFDTYQGTTHLLNLPDIRGRKEEPFREKGWWDGYNKRVAEHKAEKEQKAAEAAATGGDNQVPSLPNLVWYKPQAFIEAVEDEHTQEVYKMSNYANKPINYYNYDGLEDDLKLLQEFDEEIPIEAHKDWRSAILLAVYRFKQKKAAEMLPYAYDSYMLEFDEDEDIDTRIARRVANHQYENKYSTYDHLVYYKEEFLDGREALTGKRDFNYL
jgi:hypothetical protein